MSFSCMFCSLTGWRLISIDTVFQPHSNTIKDDIIEICGAQIKKSLKEDDLVCTGCMISMEKAVSLKKRLVNTLLTRDLDIKQERDVEIIQETKKRRIAAVKNGKKTPIATVTVDSD